MPKKPVCDEVVPNSEQLLAGGATRERCVLAPGHSGDHKPHRKQARKQPLEELISKLQALKGSPDPESAHSQADDLLVEYIGDERVAKAFEEVPRWYA